MDSDFELQEPKTRGLGRGLNALFEDDDTHSFVKELENAVQKDVEQGGRKRLVVGIDQLDRTSFQPRRSFDEDRLEELASSIKTYGVLQPLLVREDPDKPGEYGIIAGERRWRAAQRAQIHELPVIVLDVTELEAFKIAMIENLQREDLDPIDEAHGYERLLEDYNQTQDDLAKAVGKSRSHITNMLRLLTLPVEVQAYLCNGQLTTGHARALVNVPEAVPIARQIISKGLSVRQTEKLISEGKKTPKVRTRSLGVTKEKDADTIALENDMSNALGMRVSIDSADGRSGKLVVEFKSLDQLDEVLHRLAHFPGSRLSG